jgi:GT2 family glycosyltransferase
MNKPLITYVFMPICDAFIARALFTLYKFSEPGSFRVVVVDQTEFGFRKEVMDYVRPLIHLYMKFPHNLGYAKGSNEGIIHGLHWKTPLICVANDDLEIINSRWMDGIWKTFEMDPRIGAVIPMSPRVAGFGYGVDYNPEVLPYKTEYTEEEYDYLLKADFSDVKGLPPTMPTNQNNNIIDGGAFIMPYFKREMLLDVGLLDEHFFPGSGEDYDYLGRAYQKNYRIVSTSLSWVYHLWSKSKDLFASGELERKFYKPENKRYWNDMGELWPEGHDIWGKDKDGKILPRIEEVFVDQVNF